MATSYSSPINLRIPNTPTLQPNRENAAVVAEFQTVYNALRNLLLAFSSGTPGVVLWGSIGGDIADQNDLQIQFNTKVNEAPNDGIQYGRQNLMWTPVVASGSDIIVNADGLVNSTADPEAYEDFFVDGGNAAGAL